MIPAAAGVAATLAGLDLALTMYVETPPSLSDLPARVRRQIRVSDGHWLWQGKPTPNGYGQVHFVLDGKRTWLAHRLVSRLLGFPLGQNMHHECRTPICVNPAPPGANHRF